MTVAEEVVKAVLADLEGRKGIKNELGQIDPDVYAEMEAELKEVVTRVMSARAQSPTVVQLGTAMRDLILSARQSASDRGDNLAAREFSIAATAAEDAMMRYTRGRAHQLGVFKPADLDSRDAVEERREWTGNVLERMDERDGA